MVAISCFWHHDFGNEMKSWWFASIVVALSLTACRAEDETRRGEVNEDCNGGVEDCRSGLVCEDGLCADNTGDTEYSCGDFCSSIAECGATDTSCVPDCRLTIRDWSFDAQDSFTRCGAVGLTCAEVTTVEAAAQDCYTRITIEQDRQARCDAFNQAATQCSGAPVNTLTTACNALARVSTEEDWAATDRCAAALNANVCSGLATCFNDVFQLNPPLAFDDISVPSPAPDQQ